MYRVTSPLPIEKPTIVSDRRLAGSAEAAAIVGDDAMTRGEQRCHLLFPRGAAQRPAMDEHHRRSRAVVLVVEFDGAGVFLSDLFSCPTLMKLLMPFLRVLEVRVGTADFCAAATVGSDRNDAARPAAASL
jgi:hypothetical protein